MGLTPDDVRLLARLKAKLDELFPSGRDEASVLTDGHRHPRITSLDPALRAGLQQILAEELSPTVREQVAAAMRAENPPGSRPQSSPGRQALLSVQDVARHCGVAVPTVRAWIKAGHLPALTPGAGRVYRIRQQDLAAFLERRSPRGGDVAPEVDEQVASILSRVRVRVAGDKG